MQARTEKEAREWIKDQALRAAKTPLNPAGNPPGRSRVPRTEFKDVPVPVRTGRSVSWNGSGGGLLQKVQELEDAVRTLALKEPAELDRKYTEFVGKLDRMYTDCDKRLTRIEKLLGLEED